MTLGGGGEKTHRFSRFLVELFGISFGNASKIFQFSGGFLGENFREDPYRYACSKMWGSTNSYKSIALSDGVPRPAEQKIFANCEFLGFSHPPPGF